MTKELQMTRHRLAASFRLSMASAVVIVAATLYATAPAHAYWCANYRTGGTNCGFSTFGQCQAAVSGAGGFCNEIGGGAGESRSARRTRGDSQARKKSRQVERQALPRPAATKPVAEPEPAQPMPQAMPPAQPAPPAQAVPAARPRTPPANAFAQARELVLGKQYEAGLAALRALNAESHPDVATYMGLATFRLGRANEATAWYERALAADPNHRLALSFYGMLRVEQGDIPGAQADLIRIGRLCGNTSCNEYQALQSVIAAKIR
jgi:tetratricopeptide (TPR) repeat protein